MFASVRLQDSAEAWDRERQIRRGTHRSTTELEQAIEEYLRVHNENPKPFIWTKSADQIFESLKIYCERISETGH